MLTLNRGGPVIWLSEDDAKRAGIVDNDWVELFNINGAIAARAVVSQRVNPGMVLMYHAQEKIINTPGSRDHRHAGRHPQLGDTHRAQAHPHDRRLRPVQLRLQLLRNHRHQPRRVRGGAQDEQDRLARRRDRKRRGSSKHESPRTNRHGPEPGQVHRLPHLLGDLQERLDQPARHGIRLVQQRRDQARHRLPQGVGEPGQVERRLGAQQPTARSSRARATSGSC